MQKLFAYVQISIPRSCGKCQLIAEEKDGTAYCAGCDRYIGDVSAIAPWCPIIITTLSGEQLDKASKGENAHAGR